MISTALENARLYERQRKVAATLQENFIHPLPAIEGLEMAALSLPASQPELIGGDFHDVFAAPDGKVIALIGDVEGKGVAAAGLTETVRAAVRTLALSSSSPAHILSQANRLLLREGEHHQLVTALLVVLDPVTGAASLASAGHPPAVRLDGPVCETIEPRYGLPLGAADQGYEAVEFAIAAGEALVLYTDGLTEARQNGDLFGERRLLEALGGIGGRDPQQIVDGLRDAVLSYAVELKDDLEILALHTRADGVTSPRQSS